MGLKKFLHFVDIFLELQLENQFLGPFSIHKACRDVLPRLHPKPEVPDGGGPMAGHAWESVWGEE